MALFSQQQPSFSTFAKATGGRYDPTTPSGQSSLRRDILNEAQRAEAFRNAASAVQEQKALQQIQAETARPSQEVAPGMRAIIKDGKVVGYSKPLESAGPSKVGGLTQPFEKGFLAALQKASPSKSSAKPAEQMTETVTEKVTEKPVTAQAPAPVEKPAASTKAQGLVSEMQRILSAAKEAPARAVTEQKKAKMAELVAQRDEILKNLQNKRVPGFAQPMMASGGMGLFGQPQLQPLDPQGEAQLAAAIEQLNAQIAALEAETK